MLGDCSFVLGLRIFWAIAFGIVGLDTSFITRCDHIVHISRNAFY